MKTCMKLGTDNRHGNFREVHKALEISHRSVVTRPWPSATYSIKVKKTTQAYQTTIYIYLRAYRRAFVAHSLVIIRTISFSVRSSNRSNAETTESKMGFSLSISFLSPKTKFCRLSLCCANSLLTYERCWEIWYCKSRKNYMKTTRLSKRTLFEVPVYHWRHLRPDHGHFWICICNWHASDWVCVTLLEYLLRLALSWLLTRLRVLHQGLERIE